MAIYRINIDLLEAVKDEYISSAEKLSADIDVLCTVIRNGIAHGCSTGQRTGRCKRL